MNPKNFRVAKKLVVLLVALTQLAYPLVATAAQFQYLAPMRSLLVDGALAVSQASAPLVTRASVRATPTGNSFGSVELGKASAARLFTLTNLGTLAATLGTASVSAPYSVGSSCDGVVLAPLGTCQTSVVFTPTVIASVVPGSFSIPYSDTTGTADQAIALLNGTAIAPVTVFAPLLAVNFPVQAFGDVDIGSTSTKTYILSNFGNAVAPLDFSVTPRGVTRTDNCPSTMATGTQCSVTLTYAPVNTTTVSGTISVTSGSSSAAMSYSGTGVAHPGFTLSTASVAFGGVAAQASAQLAALVLNSGNVPLSTPVVSVSGSGYAATHDCPSMLAVGASCAVTMTFAPTAPQGYTGTLSVAFTDATAQTTALTGTGQGVVLALDPAVQDFGGVAIGATDTRTFNLTNSGNLVAMLGYSALPAGVAKSSTSTCAGTLAAGSSCTVVLVYTPTDTSVTRGSLTVSASDAAATLSFTGTGVANPGFYLSDSIVAFGNVATGATMQLTVSVHNSGNVPLTTPVIGTTGTGYASAHDCSATLAVGSSCTVTLSFSPVAPRGYTGTLSVAFDSATAQTTALTGTGLSALLSLDTNTLSFNNVSIGSTGVLTYTLTNSGNLAAMLSYSALPVGVTKLGTSTCFDTLAAGSSCTVVLAYAPTDTSVTTGSLTTSAANTSATLNFTGTGVAYPGFSLSASSVGFGTAATGSTSKLTVSVNNSGNVPLSTPVIATTGASYASAHDCAATLAVGSSCTVTLTFAPTSPQSYVGSLSVAFSGTVAQTAAVTGIGQQAVLSLDAATQAFGNVAIGATSSKTYTVSNSGNIAATLGYSTLPANVTKAGSSTCLGALAAGSSCTVVLVYAPTDTTTTSGAFTLSAASTSVTLNFSGTGVANPSFSLSAYSVAFGNVATGGSTQMTVSVLNSGNVPLTTPTIDSAGTSYSAVHNCAASLPVGGSCSVTLTFSPTAPQAYAGSLSVAYSSTAAQAATLGGTGQQAVLAVDLATLTFGNIDIGATGTLTYTVTNNGNIAASLGYGALPSAVTKAASSTCLATLPAGASCTVVLTYAPSDTTTTSGSVTLSATSTSTTLSFSGTGVARPAFILNGTNADYQLVPVGTTSNYAAVITNSGNVPLSAIVSSLTGAGYTKAANCPSTLAVGAQCTVTVTFSPVNVQAYLGTLTVSATGVSSQAVSLTGQGLGVITALTANTSTDFGTVLLNSSAALSFTYANTGNKAASGVYVVLVGTGLSVTSSTCGTQAAPATVAAYASCQVAVTYAPQTVAPTTGSLTVVHSDGNRAVTLSGQGSSGIYATTGTRTWADGTVAASCKVYRNGYSGHVYQGATGDGVYRIDPDGAGAGAPLDVYCDMTTFGGGWTLVLTDNLPNFTNLAGTGTATVCTTLTSCNTGGTSAFYRGTPVEATITEFLALSTDSGNPYQNATRLVNPANFVRDNTAAPGYTLFSMMTDNIPGWAPLEASAGDYNQGARMFWDAQGYAWSDGNWGGTESARGMHLRSAPVEWGHHYYSGYTFDGTNYVTGPWTFVPLVPLDGATHIVPKLAAETLYRWLMLVR